ncbi:MAG: amino acid ABC transporter substrate-binding protein [Eubacteriales bacterium]|nr:amino acid ABC transporter substrate-binding protein [Eubacteriales bacterium]
MRKGIVFLTVLALAFGMFALTGCSNDEEAGAAGWEYVENNGVLKVGLDDTFAPMGFRDEGNNLVGFDIDLATAVGEELGVEVEFIPIDWDSKELELSAKNIDCIWNGMSVTEERIANMALSHQYLNNKIVIMTLKDDVVIKSAKDLANYKIATQVDSSALKSMQANEEWESFAENILEYRTYDEAIMDMQAGRADCMVVDQVLGEYKNTKMDNVMKVCDFDFGDDYYAIGCRKGEEDLAQKLNDAIATLIENGKAEEISVKWFGTNIVMLEPIPEK